MTTATHLTDDPTDEQIEAAILNALAPIGDKLVLWTPIRDRLPGDFWAKTEALQRLFEDGKVYLIKMWGRPYVCLGDDADAEIAARAKAEGRVRQARVIA